jgi:hypothetical protein
MSGRFYLIRIRIRYDPREVHYPFKLYAHLSAAGPMGFSFLWLSRRDRRVGFVAGSCRAARVHHGRDRMRIPGLKARSASKRHRPDAFRK